MLALHKVQLLLCDERMPGMSGNDFLAIVKEMHPDTVRIVLSGSLTMLRSSARSTGARRTATTPSHVTPPSCVRTSALPSATTGSCMTNAPEGGRTRRMAIPISWRSRPDVPG